MYNWRRYATLVVLYAVALILQYGVLNNLGWGVFCPLLLVFFPVFGGLLGGGVCGLAHGLLCGLLIDLVIGRFIGLNMLVWALVGWLCGYLSRGLFKENYFIAIVSVLLAYPAGCLLYAVLVGLISGHFFSMTQIGRIILGGIPTNCFIAPLIYLPVYRSLQYGWLKRQKKKS